MKLEAFLINQESQDPVLMIPIPQKAESVIFDLGYCFRLKVKDIQRISRIFISHTHMDHFAGFDHILRMSVDLDKTIFIYGPPGIIRNVHGKLLGYTWNLKENIRLNFAVTEVHPEKSLHKEFKAKDGFENDLPPTEHPRNPGDPICVTEEIEVSCVFLEHRMPVLGFRISGVPSFNAQLDNIKEMGLRPGKWVGKLKEMMEKGIGENDTIQIDDSKFNAGEIAKKIIRMTPGTRIAYVVDTIFNKITMARLKEFINGCDKLFCECSYLDSEKSLARENYHMTARQAGRVALEGEVGMLHPCHFSRRYEGEYQKIFKEAQSVFPFVEKAKKYGEP